MFTVPAGARELLASTHYEVHVAVYARKVNSLVMQPVVDITGWFVEGTVTATKDDAAIRASLSFHRGQDGQYLTPLIAASDYNTDTPLIWPGSVLDLKVTITEPGADPGDPATWQSLFYGRIDRVDSAGPLLTVECRDWWAALFLDMWLEEPGEFGDGATFAEDVMLELQAAAGYPTPFITLPTAGSGWVLNPYAQQEMPVLEAMRNIAIQIGWDCRTLPGRGFSFYDPRTLNVTPNATIGPSEYLSITELAVDDADVRNVVEVWYGQQTTRERAMASDLDSITRYGRRFMRLVEDRTSNIDTAVEAQALAELALADCKDPFASHTIELRFWPWVELDDKHQYTANGVHYDSDQELSVVAYTHTLKQGAGRTTVSARGTPIAAYRDYRRGLPRRVHVSLVDPPTGTIAVEGALWCKVDDLSFPT